MSNINVKNNGRVRWLYGCLIFFTYSCNSADHGAAKNQKSLTGPLHSAATTMLLNKIDLLALTVRSGDVITRTGNDFTSQSLRLLNQNDQTFSHCGVACVENDTVFVYHALGGEWNPGATLQKEVFRSFASPENNNRLGIYRPALSNKTAAKLLQTVHTQYKNKLPFDMDFNLKTDDKMYCAEFVCKSFLTASDSSIKFKHSFLKAFEFVGVDDIFTDTIFKKIASIKYSL